jgi:two-component system sporulation sensor kinase A
MESMPDGGTIHVSVTSSPTHVTVTIKDEGVGMDYDLLEKVGHPFFSLKQRGTGLGLMVCNRIVKQHQGELQFFSIVGEGTTVQIVLPESTIIPR